MKRILLFLCFVSGAFAQTSGFPSSIDTDAFFRIQVNGIQTTLTAPLSSGANSATVSSCNGIIANAYVTIDQEITTSSGCSGNTLSFGTTSTNCSAGGRGCDGTSPANHSLGVPVSLYIVAGHDNSLRSAVEAIENALGVNLVNVSANWLTLTNRLVLDTRNYNFTQTPGGTVSPGANTVTLTPVPLGVNGTDSGHSLYLQAGTGTAEAVLITGGTATSGSSSGTVTFTAANSHSGAWTIGSDSCGIGEAVNIAQGVTIEAPNGTCTTHSPITMTKSFERLTGQGGAGQLGGGTIINNLAGTDGIVANGALSGALDGVEIDHLQITSSASTGGYALKVGGLSFGRLHDISVEPYPNGIALVGATEGTRYNTLTFQAIRGDGININVGDNGAGRFDDTIVGCNRQSGTNGVHALSGHGIMMSYLYVVGCANGWQSDSASGEVSYVDLVNAYFDTGTAAGNGINLVPTSTGSVFVFRGTHVTAAGFTGIGIHVGAGGTVGGVHLTDFTATINTQQGGLIEGGTDITFQNSQFIGNSNGSVGTFNGLDITAGNYINVEGSSLGAYDGQIENQGIGLKISGTTNNLVIKHNQLNNNTIASMQDTSTGIFRFISDNPGIGIPTLASATNLDLGTLDATTYDITGTTPISTINHPWDQRQVTFIKADAGSVTILNATLSQNGSVTCTYVNGATQWFCAAGGGGGGTPCVTTALSFQYNNAGSFGCVSNETWTSATGVSSITQLANGNDIVNMTRFTDTTPTGFFHHWKNAAGTDVASLDVLGNWIGNGFTSQGTTGGRLTLQQGTAPGSQLANSFALLANTSIPSAYKWTVPSADASGAVSSDGSGNLSLIGFNGSGNICRATGSCNTTGFSASTVENFTVGTGGVTINTLVITDASNPAKIVAATGTGGYGIAQATVAAAGTVNVARSGQFPCVVDTGGATAGHLVIPGSATVIDCKDSGQTASSAIPIATRIIGLFLTSASAGSTAIVELLPSHFGTQVSGGSVGACSVTGGGTATLTVTVSAATNVCPLTLSANATTVNISGGGSAGDSISFAITQGGSIFTMAAPTNFTPWPGPSQVASKVSNFTCWNQDGTNWSCGAAVSTATNGQSLISSAPVTPPTGTIFPWCDSTDLDCEFKNSAGSIFKGFLAGVDANPVTGQVTNGSHITNSSIPNSGLVNTGNTFNGQAVALGATGNVNSGAAAHSVAINEGAGAAIAGATIGTGGRILLDQGAGVDPAFQVASGSCTVTAGGVFSCGSTATGSSVTSTTPVTVTANVTTEQFLMELPLGAGFLNSLGQPFLINGAFLYTTPVAQTPTLTFNVRLCTVSGCGSGTNRLLGTIVTTATLASSTNNNANISLLAYNHATGATGTLEVHGPLSVDLGALSTSADSIFNDTNTAVSGTIDLTAALFLDFTVTTSTGSASNSITQRSGGIMPFAATAAPVTSVNGATGAVVVHTTNTQSPPTSNAYTAVAADCNNKILFSDAMNIAFTLPQAGSAGFPSGCEITVVNNNTGGYLTATTSTSVFNLGGATARSTLWQGLDDTAIYTSDGTNWTVQTHFPKLMYQATGDTCINAPATASVTIGYSGSTVSCTQALAGSDTVMATGSFTFPANFFNATTVVRVVDSFAYVSSAGSPAVTFKMKFGATSVWTSATSVSSQTNQSNGEDWFVQGTTAAGGTSVVAITPVSRGATLNLGGSPTAWFGTLATNGTLALTQTGQFAATTAANSLDLFKMQIFWMSY